MQCVTSSTLLKISKRIHNWKLFVDLEINVNKLTLVLLKHLLGDSETHKWYSFSSTFKLEVINEIKTTKNKMQHYFL